MPGVRLDRVLASTAVVLLLAAAPVGAGGKPLPGPGANGPSVGAPDTVATPPSTSPDADKASANPADASPSAASPPAPDNLAPAATTAPAPSPQPAASEEAPETPTPAAVATPPAAPAVNEADAAIADQLRNLANGKFDNLVGGKKDRMIIDAFYSGRNYQPLWITDGKANERAKAAIDYLGHVDTDGLDPADYPVPDFTNLSDPAALAEAELRLSMSVITYTHHAAVGRVHWSRVSGDIEYNQKPPEPADVLANMVEATDTAAALDAYEPKTPGYLALKAKLAEIRAGKTDITKPPIPNGPVPKIGAQDDRVPQLRDRLGVPGDGGTTYDKALADAVKKFQGDHQIKATGTLTPATIEALNGKEPDRPADIIIANMERWRWMPHDLGDTYVIVNLPDYTLRVMHDGKLEWMTRIVIGKPAMPTPIMTAEMKYITINPTWNVPPSIVNNEYLPALQQDPTVLDRMGLKVDRNPDGTVHIWQPPGDKNALGRIRFNFPNKFLVYQHDTPDKFMFAYDKRAFSHGCMRVQDPVKYAEVLLSLVRPDDHYTEDRIRKMYSDAEQDIQLPTFIPVNLTYQTAFVDDDGKLEFRDDIYGRDKALLALLKSTGEERKVADIPIERRVDVVRQQALAIPDGTPLFSGRTYYSGGPGGFFAQLFGGFSSPPPAPAHRVVHPRQVTRRDNTVER
jgi:L,D-transpeptidase YcbB